MAKLVLDLDLTAITTKFDTNNIHPSHRLKWIADKCTLDYGQCEMSIALINPDELANLIETACTSHDGLIILTSGLWDPGIREVLAEHLNLSDKARLLLRHCHFHSALTDAQMLNVSVQVVRTMPKNERLNAIIKVHEDLKGQHFVSLDDNEDQIKAFKTMRNVLPVLATPNIENKNCYETAIESLHKAKINERTLHPNHKYNGNIEVSFFKNVNKRKINESDKENIRPQKRIGSVLEPV